LLIGLRPTLKYDSFLCLFYSTAFVSALHFLSSKLSSSFLPPGAVPNTRRRKSRK
jgi:hypothetical protein